MSYTDMDIEMKTLSMLGSNVPDEDAQMPVSYTHLDVYKRQELLLYHVMSSKRG